MKTVVRFKDNIVVPVYPDSIDTTKKRAERFVYGEGTKTKPYVEILENVPTSHYDITKLELAKLVEQYGYEYGRAITCDNWQDVKAYSHMYKLCKDVLTPENEGLFELFKWDRRLLYFSIFVFDIVEFDKALGKADTEYNPAKCTYKNMQDVSMRDYVQIKYGDSGVKLVESVIESI